jgi:hypothetical protein
MALHDRAKNVLECLLGQPELKGASLNGTHARPSMTRKSDIEHAFFLTLRDLFSLQIDMVFYDLTPADELPPLIILSSMSSHASENEDFTACAAAIISRATPFNPEDRASSIASCIAGPCWSGNHNANVS